MNFKGIKQLLLFLLLVMSSSSTSNLSEDEENKFNFVVQLMCIDHMCVFVCLRYPQSFQSNKTNMFSRLNLLQNKPNNSKRIVSLST